MVACVRTDIFFFSWHIDALNNTTFVRTADLQKLQLALMGGCKRSGKGLACSRRTFPPGLARGRSSRILQTTLFVVYTHTKSLNALPPSPENTLTASRRPIVPAVNPSNGGHKVNGVKGLGVHGA